MSKVLVEVEPTLWMRVKARALECGVKLPEAVAQAFRGWLSFEGGSVATVAGEQPPAAERGEPKDVDLGRRPAGLDRKPTMDDLRQMVNAKAPGTVLDVTASTDPTRGKATVEHVPVNLGRYDAEAPISDADFRERERRRRAAQDRLRTHPEDASQDPTDDDGAGF